MKMRVLVAVLCVAACACAAGVRGARGYHADVGIPLAASLRAAEEKMRAEEAVSSQGRVINGRPAPPNGHPFFAGLNVHLSDGLESVCGSTLVSANRLVTAAHCWWDGHFRAWRFTVILGTTRLHQGGQRIPTSTVFMHPQFNTWTLVNDIAMIYLPRNVAFSASIRPATLPTSADVRNDFANHRANAAGFGMTADGQTMWSTTLNHVDLTVITVQQCRSLMPVWWSSLVPSSLCTSGAGRVGLCSGDSGGPLTISRHGQTVLIGVTSFGDVGNCQGGRPTGFARVTSFLGFINQHMR